MKIHIPAAYFLLTILLAGCALFSRQVNPLEVEGLSEAAKMEAYRSQQDHQSKSAENSALLKWSALLVAFGMVGILLPNWMVKPVEAFAAILGAFAFYALARFAQAAAQWMGYLIPIITASFAALLAVRMVMGFVKKRRGE